jgi:crotonobetainyl-CoA:carnitine CoA-transferase CaiB-like acyl-CoA transferase
MTTRSDTTEPQTESPLRGLRVLELSGDIAGPYCTKLFVDAGAEVIKVEPPEGDPLRRWTASGTPLPEGQDGALFQYLNASKRSIALDLSTGSGSDTMQAIAASVDLVVESCAPGHLAALGLGYERLQRDNPALCWVSITGWGTQGPWAHRPFTEFTLQAATGSTGYRGLPGRMPVYAGGRLGEWVAGSFAAIGGMLAWLSARNTGSGQSVDVSMFEAMLLCMTIYHDLNGQWVDGPLGRGIELPSIEPAKDGWVGLSTITGQQWKDFCSMIGKQEIGEDEKYFDGRARMENFTYMQEIIHGWTRQHTIEEIVELALLLRIPVAPLGDGRSLPDMDHFVERGVYQQNPAGFLQPRRPYRLGDTPDLSLGAAPRCNEHAEQVKAECARGREVREPAGAADDPLPLAGLRVVDLSAFWAGPFVTAVLADMGADVVKVESIQRPDGMRFAGARPGEQMWEWSPVFHGANPGKRAVTLQLDNEKGQALLRRLIADADVVVENYSPRVLENFGLGWETIHAWNPRAIMVRMPAFGLDGPWRDRTGFAMTIEQVSGLAQLTGYEDLPLVVRGACDPVGGAHAVFALLMALENRRRTGKGELVEVPLVETALNIAAEQVIEYSAYGQLLERAENRGPVSAPQGIYACAGDDELLALAVATDEQWRSLVSLVTASGARVDGWWESASAQIRRQRHDEIDRLLSAWLQTQPLAQVTELLLSAGVPASPVINAHFIMPNEQLEFREFYQTLTHPVTGPTRYPGLPMKFSSLSPRLHRSPPPMLGQHNDEILGGELGLTEEELEDLREQQIIGNRPSFM